MVSSRISELAQMVASDTAIVEKYYVDRGLPLPSFEVGGLEDPAIRDDPIAENARIALIGSCLELHDLVQGPVMQVRPWVSAEELQIVVTRRLTVVLPAGCHRSTGDLQIQSSCQSPNERRNFLSRTRCFVRTRP